MLPRLLVTEPDGFAESALTCLQKAFKVEFGPLTRSQLMDRACYFDGMIVRLAHHFDAELLERCSCLRFLATPTTGLNHVDSDAAARLGISVLSLRGQREFLDTVHATAEHTWALLMALLRHVPAAHASVLRGEWDRNRFKACELNGKTLGVIGFGRLGSMISRYAKAFGMQIVAHDPNVVPPDEIAPLGLDDLFAVADVLVVLAAYTEQTHGLIRQHQLDHCLPGALLINTSRGEILDERALLAALQSGRLAGAALDVLCDEHLPLSQRPRSKALVDYARESGNLLITPHVGGATHESMRRTEEFIAKLAVKFMNG